MDLKGSIVKLLRLENLIGHLTGYVESQVALVKLEVREEVAKILSRGLVVGVALLFAFLFLLFLAWAWPIISIVFLINLYRLLDCGRYLWITLHCFFRIQKID